MKKHTRKATSRATEIRKEVDGITYIGYYTIENGSMTMHSGKGCAYGKLGTSGESVISNILLKEIIDSHLAEVVMSKPKP
jgi:hypothetical protein